MLNLKDIDILESRDALRGLPEGKLLINTINAHSYNTAQKDELFAEALANGDVLIPDGASIVMACRWLKAKSRPTERIAGWDLFVYEMGKNDVDGLGLSVEGGLAALGTGTTTITGTGSPPLRFARPPINKGTIDGLGLSVEGGRDSSQAQNDETDDNANGNDNVESLGTAVGADLRVCPKPSASRDAACCVRLEQSKRKKRVMFLGSSERVLALIRERAAVDYPNLEVVTYSPPYKPEFSDEDSRAMVEAINAAKPDLLWIGMTAPKQEKWTYEHWDELQIDCHVGTVGAVFDFYAGTMERAPLWWQEHSLEWLYRLLKEPKRMWRRYLVGNVLFLWNVLKLKVKSGPLRLERER